MRGFIDLLLREPILALVLLGWILGLLGRVLTKAKKANQGRTLQRPASPTMAQPGGGLRGGQQATPPGRPAKGQQPPMLPSRGSQPTQAEVASEMRRILGMDSRRAVPPPKPRPKAPPPVLRKAPARPYKFGSLGKTADPDVGDRIQHRRGPMTGEVGAHEMGLLGGRRSATVGVRLRKGSTLVDLTDLPRAIVLREILDKPIGLRDWF